jgi:6-phosphogluconolactonase
MIQAFASRDEAAEAAADFIAQALQAGLETRGAACAALSGGSTPQAAYEKLAMRALDWPHILFLQVDERCVPKGSPGLNAEMQRAALAPALKKGAEFAALWHGDQAPDHAAARADALMKDNALDAALLGMGLDAHTASWFPNSHDLSRALYPGDLSVIAIEAPGADASTTRLTMTLPALLKAKALALLITGEEKRARLEHALANETQERAPILAILKARPDCAMIWAA